VKELITENLKDIRGFNPVAKAYLNGELTEFISYSPDVNGYEKAISDRIKLKVNRAVLVNVLKNQNRDADDKTKHHIELLGNENTFTVTTGHQLCLFTGPLFFIYKIVHAIKLSEELKRNFPSDNFVPVYWMASEDHDFAEVNHAFIFGKKVEWKNVSAGAVGRMSLDSFLPVLEEVKTILGDSDTAKENYAVIEKCYKEKNLAEATRKLVNHLFSDYGLIVLNADDHQLKSLFKETMKKELIGSFVQPAVEEQSAFLEAKGLKIQVKPREINLFYLAANFRERICKEDTVYFTADKSKTWTEKEILNELNLHPENFSPNVLMRAMYQETILPNITYIGGGGEISYWLQMKKMFETAGVFFPVLTVRNSYFLIHANQSEKWKSLGFEYMDLFKKEEDLMNEFISKNAASEIDFTNEREALKTVFGVVSDKLAKADVTLRASGEAEYQKAVKSLEMLEGKMRKAEKQKHELSINQIKQIKGKLFPEGEWQERRDNVFGYWTKNQINFNEFILKGLTSDLFIYLI
jgi:bacillithiol biosynthesis cysteine-adding enzyme BshC